MRSALSHLHEAEVLKQRRDLARFENRGTAQGSGNRDGLCAYKLGFELWLAVLAKELDDLSQIAL
jgi:hypothetical protein